MPRPLLEPGRLGLEANSPADLIAASSSFLLGSGICAGGSIFLGEVCLPHIDAADLTDGESSPAFSLLSSSCLIEGVDFLFELKPLKSGMSFCGGAAASIDLTCGDTADVSAGCLGLAIDGLLAGIDGLLSFDGVFFRDAIMTEAAEPGGARGFGLDATSTFASA
jgi:hypothetical protein